MAFFWKSWYKIESSENRIDIIFDPLQASQGPGLTLIRKGAKFKLWKFFTSKSSNLKNAYSRTNATFCKKIKMIQYNPKVLTYICQLKVKLRNIPPFTLVASRGYAFFQKSIKWQFENQANISLNFFADIYLKLLNK